MPELQTPSELRVERTNHTTELYEAAFGDIIRDAQTIVDLGAGDSPFGTDYTKQGKEVFRVDPQYAEVMPSDSHNVLPEFAHDISLPDHSVDVAVGAFMFQHVPKEQVADILREAARITKHASEELPDQGYIAIFPVFGWHDMRDALAKRPDLQQHVQIGFPNEDALLGADRTRRKLYYPTLVVRNTPELTQASAEGQSPLDALTEALEQSGALQEKAPTKKLGKLARKIAMRVRGSAIFDTSHV